MLCRITGTWAQLGEGWVSGNRHLGIIRVILFKNWNMFFPFHIKKIVELESNPDSTGPGQCSTILWYLGGELDRYRDDIWELPRDCDQPDKSWGWHCRQSCGTRWGWGRGCLTVQEYLPDLDVSDMPSTPTTSAEPLQIKAKDLPGTELEVCLKFAFFISQEVFFSVM